MTRSTWWVLVALAVVGCSAEPSFETGATSTSMTGSTASMASTPASSGGDGGASPDASSAGSGGDGAGGDATSAGGAPAGTGGAGGIGGAGGATGCTTPSDCFDGLPCTAHVCDDGTCVVSEVGPGLEGNPGEGACPEGLCQQGGGCGLSIYSRAFPESGSSWSRTTLSEAWLGDDAPPRTGILEADYVEQHDRFYVFADDGNVYVRQGDVWLPPQMASVLFPGLPADIRCSYAIQFTDAAARVELTISIEGDPLDEAYTYGLEADGSIELLAVQDVDRDDEPGETTPPNGALCRWAFSRQTAYSGLDWAVAYEGRDADVYRLSAEPYEWSALGLDTTSPVWDAVGTGPASQSVVAAWYENGQIHLVAP
jgi:hypothetical protein